MMTDFKVEIVARNFGFTHTKWKQILKLKLLLEAWVYTYQMKADFKVEIVVRNFGLKTYQIKANFKMKSWNWNYC